MMLLVSIALLVALTLKGLLLLALVRRRRRIVRSPGVFRCKVRVVEGETHGWPRTRWPWFACYGIWAHDVLLLYRGPALTAVVALVCRYAHGAGSSRLARMRGMGRLPHFLRLELDDRTLVEIVAPAEACEAMVGPYCSVLFGSPSAPDRQPPQ